VAQLIKLSLVYSKWL